MTRTNGPEAAPQKRPFVERAKGKDRWPLSTHNALIIEGWKDAEFKARLLEMALQGYNPEEILNDGIIMEKITNGLLDQAGKGEQSYTDSTVKLAITMIIRRLMIKGKGLGVGMYEKWKNQTRSRGQSKVHSGTKPDPQPLADWVVRQSRRPVKPNNSRISRIRTKGVDKVDEAIIEAVAEQAVPEEPPSLAPEVIDRISEMGDVIDKVIKETAWTKHDFVNEDEILEYLKEQGINISRQELSERLRAQLT